MTFTIRFKPGVDQVIEEMRGNYSVEEFITSMIGRCEDTASLDGLAEQIRFTATRVATRANTYTGEMQRAIRDGAKAWSQQIRRVTEAKAAAEARLATIDTSRDLYHRKSIGGRPGRLHDDVFPARAAEIHPDAGEVFTGIYEATLKPGIIYDLEPGHRDLVVYFTNPATPKYSSKLSASSYKQLAGMGYLIPRRRAEAAVAA